MSMVTGCEMPLVRCWGWFCRAAAKQGRLHNILHSEHAVKRGTCTSPAHVLRSGRALQAQGVTFPAVTLVSHPMCTLYC